MKDNLVVRHDMSVYPCILMLGVGESRYKLHYDGDYTAIRNAYESLQLKNVLDRAPECRKCKDLNYCSPCIPYIEHGIDYRCSGKRDTESANSVMGCPLATRAAVLSSRPFQPVRTYLGVYMPRRVTRLTMVVLEA